MSRTWTAATPVRVTDLTTGKTRYVSYSTARLALGRTNYDRLVFGEIVEVEYENGATYQLIPEAVAMADLPLENGR